ncbi:hypothetical protein Cantr_01467 [Candida viswanathii]|uniref:Uncharacterized protein n=1 Tax=Candida viswanathii TaxID=5486 RepID=A0A367YJ64_9ASCO|nr:hypothetical protein Cantr_01467 [Candida viswanathii]
MKFTSFLTLASSFVAVSSQLLPTITAAPEEVAAKIIKRGDDVTTYWVTEYAPSTSIVTVTKCSEDKCSESAVPTGVTKTTTVIAGVTTAYTTYCPLTTSHEVVKSTCSGSLVIHSTISKSWYWNFPKPSDCDETTSTIKPIKTCNLATPIVTTTCTTGKKTKLFWVYTTTDCFAYTVTGGSSTKATKTTSVPVATPTVATTCTTSKFTSKKCVYTKKDCSIYTVSGSSSSLISTTQATESSELPTTITSAATSTSSTQGACVPTKITSCTTGTSKKLIFWVVKTTSCSVLEKCGTSSSLVSTSVASSTVSSEHTPIVTTTHATPTVSTICTTSKFTSNHCVYTKTDCSIYTCSGTSSSLISSTQATESSELPTTITSAATTTSSAPATCVPSHVTSCTTGTSKKLLWVVKTTSCSIFEQCDTSSSLISTSVASSTVSSEPTPVITTTEATPTVSTTCTTSKFTSNHCVYTKTDCFIFTCSGTSSSLISTTQATESSELPPRTTETTPVSSSTTSTSVSSSSTIVEETSCYTTIPTTASDEIIITSYTTETAHTTSIVTVTSCSQQNCETHTTKTGVVVITVTTTDVETIYTTYCPLTTTYAVFRIAKIEPKKRDVTEVATDDNIFISSWQPSTLVPSVLLSGTTASISTFEGAGNPVLPRIGALAGVLAGLLFLL